MDVTITIRGEKHTFENVESFDKTADPQGNEVLLIDGEEVLSDAQQASSFSVIGFGQCGLQQPRRPTTENTPINTTLPKFQDCRSYETFIYDLYQIMADELAYNVLASFTTHSRFRSYRTTVEFGAKGLQLVCSPIVSNDLDWGHYRGMFNPNPYDIVAPDIPSSPHETEIDKNKIDWTEAASQQQYWVEVPKLLYYVCATDVANTIIGGVMNTASLHNISFGEALSNQTEEHLTDAQISSLGLDNTPTNEQTTIPTTN